MSAIRVTNPVLRTVQALGRALCAALVLGLAMPAEAAETSRTCQASPDLVLLKQPLPRTARLLAAHEPLTVVALGSSSTAGAMASSPAHSYPSQLEVNLGTLFPRSSVKVLNKGSNGEVASDMLARLDRDVLAEHPDLVIWQTGSNSILRGYEVADYQELVRTGIARLRAAGIDVMLLNPQYAPKVLDRPMHTEMIQVIRRLADEARVPVFDRYGIMQAWIESGRFAFSDILAADLTHHNDFGYGCLGRLIADAIAARVVPDSRTLSAHLR